MQQISSVFFKRSKYKTGPFNEILRENFGDDLLFGGDGQERRYQRKVAVVSAHGTGQEAVILANYNRPRGDEQTGNFSYCHTLEILANVYGADYKFERPFLRRAEIKIWEALDTSFLFTKRDHL